MPISLFGYDPKSRVEDSIGSACNFKHTFGGNADDFGIRYTDAPLPLHLVYRLDLSDPLIPLDLPNLSFLSLLYCFNYDSTCCYQVISDTEVRLITPGEQECFFPPWEAPEAFSLEKTSFSAKRYDPTRADDVMDWKGVYGWDELSEDQRKIALDLASERTFLTREDGPDDDWTYADVIRSMYHPPFSQSRPYHSCGNPDCNDDRLRVIALQHNVVSAELIWPGKHIQTIWEMCEGCQCIVASNQCG
ncbi:hypothetical protein [Roseimaritima ulvae]|uniref:Uncharacterized protein n=1 Tax=Roseimaritima ulvae TaxID=980254 RepID=A0A5B9R0Y3_9BACT|nr:hypothetical protein [Roseimaritima ulvae]QEG43425.1 hypothetical protein UC8_54740 [Roseimaritima ulvae]